MNDAAHYQTLFQYTLGTICQYSLRHCETAYPFRQIDEELYNLVLLVIDRSLLAKGVLFPTNNILLRPR